MRSTGGVEFRLAKRHLLTQESDFTDDPLSWLLRAAGRSNPIVPVDGARGIARASDSAGTVAVFGANAVRAVLSDSETFGMPVSISARYAFPPILTKLNSALFSMTGAPHRRRQRVLSRALGPTFSQMRYAAIDRGLTIYLGNFGDKQDNFDVDLFDSMRRLARIVAVQVIFGDQPGGNEIGAVAQLYFDLRRRYASKEEFRQPVDLDTLISVGTRLDSLLRSQVRSARGRLHADDAGLIQHLCRTDGAFDDDDLVAHANILFMSSSEPIATAMTWIVLALSQDFALCHRIRADLAYGSAALVHGLVREVLRVVPPSAIIARLTTRRAVIGGTALPVKTEILISPFVEHRRARVFRDPHRFFPDRWGTLQPGPFEYLPFGGGVRSCLGKRIALETLERATAALVQRFDVLLPRPQSLDWRMNTTLQPAAQPLVRFTRPGNYKGSENELSGKAAELLCVDRDR